MRHRCEATSTSFVVLWIWLAGCEPASDAQPPPPLPGSLGDVLDCGQIGPAGGLGAGTSLQRVDLDLQRFPDAVCNDGTGGFFYFRPSTGGVNADKWLIQLQGGGACSTPDECFGRWCSVGTNFGMQGMTADKSPSPAMIQSGILNRRPENPLGGYNHVFVRYCSSDSWVGSASTEATGAHPVTGESVTATIHFRGYDILSAVIGTLRQDGTAPPTYTLGNQQEALPDLDDAVTVVLAGASAGGAGTIHNADRVGAELRQHNPDLFEFGALVDSVTPGSPSHYEFSSTPACVDFGLCTFDAFEAARWANNEAFLGTQVDTSCRVMHSSPAVEHLCNSNGHVLEHHVTTPFFVRMGQTDQSLVVGQVEGNYTIDGAPLTLAQASGFVREDLARLADPAGNEEASDYVLNPGVYSPFCPDHEVLSDNDQVYDVVVDVDGDDVTMFGLLVDWRLGLDPAVVISVGEGDSVCP